MTLRASFPLLIGAVVRDRTTLSWALATLVYPVPRFVSSSARGTMLAQKMPCSLIHTIISSLLLLSAMFAGVCPATVGVTVSI